MARARAQVHSSTQHGDRRYSYPNGRLRRSAANSAAGLVCPRCDRFHDWRDMNSRIVAGGAWEWWCPRCDVVVRVDYDWRVVCS